MNAREILDRTDLAELLSLSGPPTGTGRAALVVLSPDHQDDHPSVSMFVDHKGLERWRCWSDGHAGTAIDAVMIGHNLDVTALRWLQERAGTSRKLPPDSPPPPRHARCPRRCTPGRTTVSIACGVPKARTHAPGSTQRRPQRRRPPGQPDRVDPDPTSRPGHADCPAGEASPSARSTVPARWPTSRSATSTAKRPASTATRPHNTAPCRR